MSETEHLDFPPLSFDDKGNSPVEQLEDLAHVSQLIQRATHRVNALVQIENHMDMLLIPDILVLDMGIEEARKNDGYQENSIFMCDTFFSSPLPEIKDLGVPENIVAISDTEAKLKNHTVVRSEKDKKLEIKEFDDIGPYYSEIYGFLSRIKISTIESGTSGIAVLLYYMVEILGVFPLDDMQNMINKDDFLEEANQDIFPDDFDYFVGHAYRITTLGKNPKFQTKQILELEEQFMEYFSLYYGLKNRKKKALCRLGEAVLIPKINFAEESFITEGVKTIDDLFEANRRRRENRLK